MLNSWADIVKFGQSKPQADVTTKKTTKSVVVKRTVVPKPKVKILNVLFVISKFLVCK